MPLEQTPKITPRLGVPSEARLQDQRQRESESESRRYSNITPAGRIAGGWQFTQKMTQRQWSAREMGILWLVMGVPSIALMVAGVLSALGRSTPAERAWGIAQACVLPGIPLLALLALTRKWLLQRRFARAVRRRS
jgi:hypothetical protein